MHDLFVVANLLVAYMNKNYEKRISFIYVFSVCLPENHQILYHFFAQVVIYAVNFFLTEQCCKMT